MEKYFEFLNDLRDEGVTNMFGAVPYLQEEFAELTWDRQKAIQVLQAWMASFREENE